MSSVVTTLRQSSAISLRTEDCPSTSSPLTSILIVPRVSTPELQEANTESNDTYPPHPNDYQRSVHGRHSRTRFTLHRLLSAVIPVVFVASKFIDSFHGRALTLGFLDLIAAILVFMLNVFSWFESDPPPSLGWLFDTDWDCLLDVTKRGVLLIKDLMARRAKTNLMGELAVICLSACKDGQLAFDDRGRQLTMTKCFIDAVAKKPNITRIELLEELKDFVLDLRKRHEETCLEDFGSESDTSYETCTQELEVVE